MSSPTQDDAHGASVTAVSSPDANAAATSSSIPPPPPPLQRTQTDPNTRSCFICLQNPTETPNAVWVNACPCTLEAHEDCMLHWIAEHERESTKSLRCPACKGKIKTVEPHDRFVGIRDRIHKMYSRVTPAILLGILTGCSMAGSSYYGMLSICVFAGPAPAMGWLGLGKALADRRLHQAVPWYRWRAGWDFCFRFWLLHFIAPALMIQKALPPQLIDFLAVPASVFYGASLVLRDDMPQWPPSPAWVLTALPWVSFSYNRIYHDLFGAYERRLNQALRGRGIPNDEGLAAGINNGGGNQRVDAAEANNRAAADEQEEGGFLFQALRVGNAVLDMMGDDNNDDEVVAEIELHIGPGEDEEAAIQELQEELNEIVGGPNGDAGLVVVQEDSTHVQDGQQIPTPPAEPAEDGLGADAGARNPEAQPAAAAIRIQPHANANDNANANAPANEANNNLAPEEPIREARGTSTTLSDVVNGVVSALTFPLVCWGAGEILRCTLPTPWVTRAFSATAPPRPATGLLQEQWGRSLVGGALFIVARDMVNLYTKHRRVEIRKHRRVRNVPRRVGGGKDGKNGGSGKTQAVARQGSAADMRRAAGGGGGSGGGVVPAPT